MSRLRALLWLVEVARKTMLMELEQGFSLLMGTGVDGMDVAKMACHAMEICKVLEAYVVEEQGFGKRLDPL